MDPVPPSLAVCPLSRLETAAHRRVPWGWRGAWPLLLLLGLAPSASRAAELRVGLVGVRASAGVSPEVASAFEQALEAELRRASGLTVTSSKELAARVGLERQRQLLGEPTSAGASLAGAADAWVVATLTASDKLYRIDVQRYDAGFGSVRGSRSIEVRRGDTAELLAAPRPLVLALFPERTAAMSGATPAVRGAKPLRVAVLEARAVGAVPERALAALNQAFLPELRKIEGVSAIGSGEIRDMLSLERQRELLGCSGGATSCLAELAGALNGDELVTLDLTLVGSTYTLAARRIGVSAAEVHQAHHQTFDKRDGEELLAVVGPTVEALYPDRPLKPGRLRGVEAAVIRRLNPPPLPKWAFFTTGALAVAGGAVGGIFTFQQLEASNQFRRLATRSLAEPVAGSELVALDGRARAQSTIATGFFAAASGLLLAAVIEALFTDWRDERASLSLEVAGPLGAAARLGLGAW